MSTLTDTGFKTLFRFRAVLTTLLNSQTNYPVLMRSEKVSRLSDNAYEKEEILCHEMSSGIDMGRWDVLWARELCLSYCIEKGSI